MKVRIVTGLKRLFIPHHGNDYKPHFFREAAVSAMLFISVFLLGSSFGSSFFIHRTVLGAEIASSVLIDLTNQDRMVENQVPLIKNEKLSKAAQLKGEDMVSKGYFSHNSPEGVAPWHWFKKAGYTFLYAGENLAINFTDSEDVERAWLNSPLHRANILNGAFREIGIATVPGVYNNYPTIYIVQMFGTPAYAEMAEDTSVEEVALPKIASSQTEKKVDTSSTTDTRNVISGNVKGDSVSGSKSLTQVGVEGDIVVVKNSNAIGPLLEHPNMPPVYSSWYERIVFNGSKYIDVLYKSFMILIAFALVTMVLVEIRRQHYKHIMYGFSLLFILQLFIYINQSFF